jgi:hypothetical protein
MDETMAHEPRDASAEAERKEAAGRFVYASGSRPLDGYTIKRAIGRGGFGEVYYAVTDAGKEVALKLIMRNLEVERRGVLQCMNLKSPHLIGIHDLRANDDDDTFVIMEYVAGPSLESILRRYPAGMPHNEVRHWLKGLVEGVAYLHDHGIVHRDLKPANLFMEEGVVKIGDYGLSKAITNSREPSHSQSVGTCHYMAPEIGTGKYHKPIDIYAIGIILYEMVTGRVPFDGESVHEVLMKHLTARPELGVVPEPFRSVVARALAKDPNLRPERVTDLLLPGDARKEPAVRFITDGKAAAAGGPAEEPSAAGPAAEEVFRIGPEEPVLYIGPDTRPPRPRRAGLAGWFRPGPKPAPARRAAPPVTRAASPPPIRPARQARAAGPRRAPAPAAAPATAPEPTPEPPALPSGRVRVGELAGSMLLAAPLAVMATLLAVPGFEAFGARHPQEPGELALFFSTVLMGSWGVLGASKSCEARSACAGSRRSAMLAVGLAVGLATAALSAWGHLGLPGDAFDNPATREFVARTAQVQPSARPFLAFGAYFALAFAASGLPRLAARDRKARFRFLPVGLTALAAGLVGAVVPSPQPWAALSVAAVAVVAQLSSPWSREAAAYALYARTLGRGRRGRAA